MKLRAKRGRNQQGLSFVSTEAIDSKTLTYALNCNSTTIYSDVRESAKVPEGIIILDARVYDMLQCAEDDEINIVEIPDIIPTCTEIHLDIISKRALQNDTVAHAISKRIDDFQEHFEGLVLQTNQEFVLSDLGISFVVRFMSPTDPTTSTARISWKNLLKIQLGTLESQPNNLYIIAEVAAATQIEDVMVRADNGTISYMSRHQASLLTLERFEKRFNGYGNNVQFAGLVFSDNVLPFNTFDSQTGEETEITSLDSSSLISAFRKLIDNALDQLSNRPSNPGAALKYGIEKALSLSEKNGLPTTIIFFSSGVYTAGQNPVKVTRTNATDKACRVLCISLGKDAAVDIMDAIAKEGNGLSYNIESDDRINSIVDAINNLMTSME